MLPIVPTMYIAPNGSDKRRIQCPKERYSTASAPKVRVFSCGGICTPTRERRTAGRKIFEEGKMGRHRSSSRSSRCCKKKVIFCEREKSCCLPERNLRKFYIQTAENQAAGSSAAVIIDDLDSKIRRIEVSEVIAPAGGEDLAAQLNLIWDRIAFILAQAGATLADIDRVVAVIEDLDAAAQTTFNNVLITRFGGATANFPARTVIGGDIAAEGALVAISVWATVAIPICTPFPTTNGLLPATPTPVLPPVQPAAQPALFFRGA